MDTPDKRHLDTSNPDHIIYQYDMIEITILGGIRLEGLDRLRVTLKIQVEHLAVRHNLDLYNDTQVEKLIRKVAEKLEIGTSVIAAALLDLTTLIEQHRLDEIERQNTQHDKRKMLAPDEIKTAQVYLSAPNLMQRTIEDIGRAGVIGEETNRLLMYLIFTSRKRENPLHVISLGSSGIGKTHLQEKVGQLIPEEDKIEITTLSENAFYYFGQRQLQHKLILIEDLDGAEGVLYPLRELQSKKRINKTVVHKNTKGETRSINLTVEGPVSVAGCTTRESLYEDNANRNFLIYIDESEEQDQRIMAYQRAESAGRIDKTEQFKIVEQFQNMQRVLQPVQIRNPYAESLQIPGEVFKPRRTNAHYLAFIEVVTFYHQYQREKQYDKETGEEYIETTLEDIREANELLKDVLIRKSDLLTGACRNYFERLKSWLKKEGKNTFANKEIRQVLRTKSSTLKRYHQQLLEAGMIRVKAGKRYKGYEYEISNQQEYEELRTGIGSVLDQVFMKLDKPSSPSVAQKQNGPVKNKKAS
jgi:predicted transcriptional regulator